jgi:hypothetical protein
MSWTFSNTGIGGGFGISPSGNPGGGMNFAAPTIGIVTSGLVINLDAGNAASYPGSGTTWTDLSGNNINGTLTNGPTFNSANGGSIVFDGSDDYCIFDTTSFPSGNSPFTMEVFVKKNVVTTVPIFAYGRDQVGGNTIPVLLLYSSNLIGLTFGSTTGDVFSTTVLSSGVWYHVCASYTTLQTKIYVNGTLENSTNYSSANIILDNTVNGNKGALAAQFSPFGNISGPPRRYGTFTGNIAKAALYNRALTDGEILQNFNALRGRFGI